MCPRRPDRQPRSWPQSTRVACSHRLRSMWHPLAATIVRSTGLVTLRHRHTAAPSVVLSHSHETPQPVEHGRMHPILHRQRSTVTLADGSVRLHQVTCTAIASHSRRRRCLGCALDLRHRRQAPGPPPLSAPPKQRASQVMARSGVTSGAVSLTQLDPPRCRRPTRPLGCS